MENTLQKREPLKFLAAVLLLVVGGFCIANPTLSALGIIWVIGIGLCVYGAVAVFHSFRMPVKRTWDMVLGILYIVLGVVVTQNQLITATAIGVIVGVWFFVNGALTVYSALRHRQVLLFFTIPLVWGIVSMALGLIVLTTPLVPTVGVGMVIGIYALTSGVVGIVRFALNEQHTW